MSRNAATGSGGKANGALCEDGPTTMAVSETTVTSRSLLGTKDPKDCSGLTSIVHIHDGIFAHVRDPNVAGLTVVSPKDVTKLNSA